MMKIDITIKFDLDEIKEILVNADELQKWVLTHIEDMRTWVMSFQEGGLQTNNIKDGEKDDAPPQEDKKPVIKLEDVRHLLATLSQSGKQKEVKALIQKFGAKKLTDIPEEKYPELLEEAEAI